MLTRRTGTHMPLRTVGKKIYIRFEVDGQRFSRATGLEANRRKRCAALLLEAEVKRQS